MLILRFPDSSGLTRGLLAWRCGFAFGVVELGWLGRHDWRSERLRNKFNLQLSLSGRLSHCRYRKLDLFIRIQLIDRFENNLRPLLLGFRRTIGFFKLQLLRQRGRNLHIGWALGGRHTLPRQACYSLQPHARRLGSTLPEESDLEGDPMVTASGHGTECA